MQKILLAALAATLSIFTAAAADISGSWTLTGDVVGNAINMKCAFTQDGTKVTGTCGGAMGNSPTTGTVTDDKVTLQHSITQGQTYDLTYSGTLDGTGNTIRGDIAVMGVTGTFSATKDAAPKEAAPTGFGGAWTFTGDVANNPVDMKCAFRRDGDKLTGNCAYKTDGDSPTTGTVAGDTITFRNRVAREQTYDLTYTGKLDATGTSMKGEIAVAGVTGDFSGTKDK